jgi:hypothetical protein
MLEDTVRLKVVAHTATTAACGLCATDPASLVATVLVHHMRGRIVHLGACNRRMRARQRLLAVIGSEGHLATAPAPVPSAPSTLTVVLPRRQVRSRPRVLGAELLLEYRERPLDVDGTEYEVRAWGGSRKDGVWAGWLEFAAVGKRQVQRTGQETTQRSGEA